MQIIQIHFDGGCRPTNPGNKYGSYEVDLEGEVVQTVREAELGPGTNNEAEFEILISALEWTRGSLEDYGYPLSGYRLELFTDSTIVRNRISGRNQSCRSEPQSRMFALADRARKLMEPFGGFAITWNGREANLCRFGH